MINTDAIQSKFQKVCEGENRYIGLIFRLPGESKTEFGTVRILGKNDSLDHALITANHIGQECVALVELDRRTSAWLDIRRGNRMSIIEDICRKISSAGLQP